MVQVNNTKQIMQSLKEKLYKKNTSYYYAMTAQYWDIIVGDILAEYSYPTFLDKQILYIAVSESHYFHQFLMLKEELMKNINDFLHDDIVQHIEIIRKKQIILPKPKKNIDINMKNIYEQIHINIDEILLTDEEEREVLAIFDSVDPKYETYIERAKKIALNKKKQEKGLLLSGYVRCEICQELFFPHNNSTQYVCIKCVNKQEMKKLEYIIQVIKAKPYISFQEVEQLVPISERIFLRARDILAEDVFYDMLEQTRKNITNQENNDFIHNKEQEYSLFNQSVRQYMMYKVGTDDEEMYKIIRKKILKKINKFIYFYKKNKIYT